MNKLQVALWEADRHAEALSDALSEWDATPVMSLEQLEQDRLNRLEKLGYLNVDDWLRWRELRNRLAHEYPDQPELRFATLRAAAGAAHELVAAYGAWRQRLAGAGLA
ncbi:hypothetical protein [Azohydromonas aeria]|uniref:hypothetical protein n=1 Tax=Azohydromonas aeria TaxID=2590212 RepID=UPI0012FB932F|nr:hypothetical protein [Azohydromonas aeria]